MPDLPPEVAPLEPRELLIGVRLTTGEAEVIDDARRRCGLRNRSELIRAAVRYLAEQLNEGLDGVELGRRLIG